MTSHCSPDSGVLDRRVHQLICIYSAESPVTEAFSNITQRLITGKLSEVAFKLILFIFLVMFRLSLHLLVYSIFQSNHTCTSAYFWYPQVGKILIAVFKSHPHWKTSFWFVSKGGGKTFSFHDDGFQVHKASLVLQQVLMKLRNKQQQRRCMGKPLSPGKDMSMEFHSSSKTWTSR